MKNKIQFKAITARKRGGGLYTFAVYSAKNAKYRGYRGGKNKKKKTRQLK